MAPFRRSAADVVEAARPPTARLLYSAGYGDRKFRVWLPVICAVFRRTISRHSEDKSLKQNLDKDRSKSDDEIGSDAAPFVQSEWSILVNPIGAPDKSIRIKPERIWKYAWILVSLPQANPQNRALGDKI